MREEVDFINTSHVDQTTL